MSISAAELARQLDITVVGDGDVDLVGVSSLTSARAGTLTFLVGDRYKQYLKNTSATAVVLKPEYVDDCPVTALVADDPYLTYAKAAQLLYPQPSGEGIVHPAAIIGEGCSIHESVSIAAGVVIEDGVKIDAGVRIGPGSVIGSQTEIGAYTLLEANISCMHNVRIGQRCIIHSGAVIGCDGFGFANDSGQWIKIPQVGSVSIGDDVEIGANTTVDRGAIDDTIIGHGVKLDNQIQIAHNVQIGDHTAIAACTGIAGSTTIGTHCAIGGGVGIVGHITITDRVTITATSFVTGSIKKSGSYSSGVPLEETRSWRRNYIRFRQLDDMAKKLKKQDN